MSSTFVRAADHDTRVGVVAVVYGQSDDELDSFLGQVSALTGPPLRVWLVSNEPGRDLGWATDRVELIESAYNSGWTGGANAGARAAFRSGCSHVLLMNTDTEILSTELITQLLTPFQSATACGLVSPGIVLGRDHTLVWYRGARVSRWTWIPRHPGINHTYIPSGKVQRVQAINGCCVLALAALFEELDGFDEDLFSYFDDPDLSLRAASRGWASYLVDKPLLAHDTGGRALTPVSAFYFGRNPFILARKWTPRRGWFLVLASQLLLAPSYLTRCNSPEARRSYLRGLRAGFSVLRHGTEVRGPRPPHVAAPPLTP